MSNYHTYSDYKMKKFWMTKATWAGVQTVFAAILVIAAIAFSGFQPMM